MHVTRVVSLPRCITEFIDKSRKSIRDATSDTDSIVVATRIIDNENNSLGLFNISIPNERVLEIEQQQVDRFIPLLRFLFFPFLSLFSFFFSSQRTH